LRFSFNLIFLKQNIVSPYYYEINIFLLYNFIKNLNIPQYIVNFIKIYTLFYKNSTFMLKIYKSYDIIKTIKVIQGGVYGS
jgi:hypothetical protein